MTAMEGVESTVDSIEDYNENDDPEVKELKAKIQNIKLVIQAAGQAINLVSHLTFLHNNTIITHVGECAVNGDIDSCVDFQATDTYDLFKAQFAGQDLSFFMSSSAAGPLAGVMTDVMVQAARLGNMLVTEAQTVSAWYDRTQDNRFYVLQVGPDHHAFVCDDNGLTCVWSAWFSSCVVCSSADTKPKWRSTS